ncbi:MAG: hypothetical protein LBN24_10565, partial [Mediterranea sp.]|nr:hypothetical protein [Mediterranea sp.]
MMLNASADNGPRVVNIGLPASVGGTVILENGLPVVYDYAGQMPTAVWRQDAGIAKFGTLDITKTALFASDVGVSVSTWTNRGTDKFKGSAAFNTNSFGLWRGDVGVSGPLSHGFYYSLTAYVNMDPGTFRSNISTFLDKTQIYKVVLNKKYRHGQIGIQYKYSSSEAITTKNSPYIYHKDGSVDAMPGFRIGRDSYLEQSSSLHVIDPLTGEQVTWNAMKDMGSTTHVIDLLGDHHFGKGYVLDYTVRFQHANSGQYNPYLTSIEQAPIPKNPQVGDKAYFYADNPDAPYTGYVQNGMMIAAPRSVKNTVMMRFELTRKTKHHEWMVGFHNWYYDADKVTQATYSYQFEVKPNPHALIYKQFDGNTWVEKTDKFGNRNYNAAMQYYNGVDNKMALVGTEKWDITRTLTLNLGTRLEWQHLNGDWYDADDRKQAGTNWVSGKTSDVKKNWWNVTGTGNLMWKLLPNLGTPERPMSFGLLADGMYIQQAGKLSAYSGADDPHVEKCEISGFSGGVYFNSPFLNIVSKVTKIKRTNFKNNSTFNKKQADGNVETTKQTVSYDVNSLGWTTDLLLKPFKGFQFHALLTLQNPKYENYEVDVFGEHYSNTGNVARSVSKTLIELDPSYMFGKFNI